MRAVPMAVIARQFFGGGNDGLLGICILPRPDDLAPAVSENDTGLSRTSIAFSHVSGADWERTQTSPGYLRLGSLIRPTRCGPANMSLRLGQLRAVRQRASMLGVRRDDVHEHVIVRLTIVPL
jgi:hypothetical protein